MATIAFDAKRAFANATGLGNYSRTLVDSLSRLYPEHEYLLLAPHTRRNLCQHLLDRPNIRVRRPSPPLAAMAGPLWRRYGLVSVLKRERAGLYHGLSHELPLGMAASGIPSVVTIHDMLPFRHPELFGAINSFIYRRKFRHACLAADRIIAVSQQTATDILHHLDPEGTSGLEEKIRVIHQSCDQAFHTPPSLEQARSVSEGLGLPREYILYVGSVIERKNLLGLVRAVEQLAGDGGPPHLAVVGTGRGYLETVRAHVRKHGLEEIVTFLGQVSFDSLPALYRAASVFVYPSSYEGFGIPIIEAQHCLCPVVTSTGSCFPEAGGPHSVYVETRDAQGPERMACAIKKILSDTTLARDMAAAGKDYVARFDPTGIARTVMELYSELLIGDRN